MVVIDDFGVYYQGVTRSVGFETVLRKVAAASIM